MPDSPPTPSDEPPTCIIMQLGSSNDASGGPDAEAHGRAERVKALYDGAVAAGQRCFVLASGGASDERFNPTSTPHWEYIAELLAKEGIPAEALIRPGLPSMHTVDEALKCREFVEGLLRERQSRLSVVVVTTDWHAPRARHLFGVAFGKHAGLDVEVNVVDVPAPAGAPFGCDSLDSRLSHEQAALKTLRTAPFGEWLEFLRSHGLEACNRSLRHSRRLGSSFWPAGGSAPPTPAPPKP